MPNAKPARKKGAKAKNYHHSTVDLRPGVATRGNLNKAEPRKKHRTDSSLSAAPRDSNTPSPTSVTDLSQLESHLWEAANILRGPVDAADFKTYVVMSRR
jgi:hypothetical protein